MQSLRLQKMINLIPDGVGVADIGTDHAMIPIHLAQHTNCHPIIAGEKNRGPLQTAFHWIREAGLENQIDLRLGSGLTIIDPGEVEWAIIAGMGFRTIIQILEEAEHVARSLKGLILQPMQGPEELRLWLSEHSFQIVDEALVEEDGRLFQIIKVQSGPTTRLDPITSLIGPALLKKGDSLLVKHLESLIMYQEEVRAKIPNDQGEGVQVRIQEINQTISKLKEVLHTWQKKCNE